MKGADLAEGALSFHRPSLCFGEERGCFGGRRGQKGSAERESITSVPIGQEAEVADFHKPGRKDVEQETTNEFGGFERHELLLVRVGRVPPAKSHLSFSHLQ